MQLAKDIMTRDVVCVPSTAIVDVAIDMMLNHNVSGVPVVDDSQRLVGVITEFDVLKLFGRNDRSALYADCDSFMTRNVKSIQAEASVEVAARIFQASPIRRLLVVSGETLVGVLSRRDILRCIHEQRNGAAAAQ